MLAAQLSTIEIKNYLDYTVLLPFGSFEQHGPFLPLSTDYVIAEEICKRVEKELPEKVLLYPTLWIGNSSEHEGFAGTVSQDVYTMMKYLENIFIWLEKSGLKKGILYNAHGGNKALADTICEDFSRRSNFKIKSFFGYNKAVDIVIKECFGYGSTHAGGDEISLFNALKPDLAMIQDGIVDAPDTYTGSPTLSLSMTKDLSLNGILSPVTSMEVNSEKGKKIAQMMQDELIQKILNFKLQ